MNKRVTVIVEGREYIVEVGDLDESPIKATVNNKTYEVEVPPQGQEPAQDRPPAGPLSPTAEPTPQARPTPRPQASTNSAVTAPMPGNIEEVRVKAGDSVNPGDVVCVLEAMKMKNMIYTNQAGVIASVEVAAGQSVDYGAVLVTFEK